MATDLNVDLNAVSSKAEELRGIARELFGEATMEFAADPEIADLHYLVISVRTSGEPREVANRRRKWHQRTASLLGEDCGKVQLLIDITE